MVSFVCLYKESTATNYIYWEIRDWWASVKVYEQHFLIALEGSCSSILFRKVDIPRISRAFLVSPCALPGWASTITCMKTTPMSLLPGLISLPKTTHTLTFPQTQQSQIHHLSIQTYFFLMLIIPGDTHLRNPGSSLNPPLWLPCTINHLFLWVLSYDFS